MKTFLLCIVLSSVFIQDVEGFSFNLTATPNVIIPGIDRTLTINCDLGSAAGTFRHIFFLQLEKRVNGNLVPIATVAPGRPASLEITDNRLAVSGNLDNSPATASLQVVVDVPTDDDAGRYQCQATGLGMNGRELSFTQAADIRIDPEAHQVDEFLKVVVWDLREEANKLMTQASHLENENHRLAEETAKQQTALAQEQAALTQLQTQLNTLQLTVSNKEVELEALNKQLLEEIANISRNAPAQRVAFNAVERTERPYPSGHQVEFETVELNEGNAYNVSTSTFQPPVDGLYFFTSGQLAHDTAGAGYRAYTIRKNTTIIGAAYNGDDRQGSTFEQSSTSSVAEVKQYDLIRVYTQYASSSTTNLAPYQSTPQGLATNFAGYLVY